MDMLYTLTIHPLELLYKFLYLFLARVTGTYSLSLLCLSMVSYAVFHPLKKLTAAMRERERRAQALIAPQLAAIKKESQGAERQARTAALYRRYGYHPLLALRSSAGILLQVPFLIAAYAMISALEPIRGLGAFGIIPDLGAPDGLLFGLNALPLIMTGVNLLAVFTTRGFARGDKLQGSLIALLFLALLYPAPSALLIYWTGNNILMLLENGLRGLARLRPLGAPRKAAKAKTPPADTLGETRTTSGFLRAALPACAAVFAIPSVMALRSYAWCKLSGSSPGDLSGLEVMLNIHQAAGLLIFIMAAIWAGRRIRRLPPLPRPFLYALIAGLTLWSLYTLGRILARGDDFSPTLILLFYDGLTAALGVCLVIGTDWRGCLLKCHSALTAGSIPALYTLSSLTLALTLGFLSPYALYNSSPEHFGVPFSQMLGSILPYMVLLLFLCFLLHLALPSALRPWLACVWLGLALLVFFNSTIFTGDYGALNHVFLDKSSNLNAPLRGAADLFIFLLIFLVLFAVYYFRAARAILLGMAAACAAMLLAAAAVASLDLEAERRSWAAGNETPAETPAETPLERGGLLSLSKTRPNIMVFFLDMFTGGHVEDIFAEYPGLIPRFSGFTWYPDTLALGERTSWSAPSIMGGQNFTPDRLNQRPDSTLAEKYTEAAAVLPRAFGAHGYATTYLNHPYRLNNALINRLTNGTPPRIERLPGSALRRRWEQTINPGSAPPDRKEIRYPPEFVLLISLFKAVPHTRKGKVYNDGLWLPDMLAMSGLIQHMFNATLYESAVLGLLPELAGTEAERPTLAIVYSMLPHSPWRLPKDSLIPVENPYPATKTHNAMVDGVIPAHVYTETHTLRLLADFFDWLRTEGLYDNTMIVLISDHCDGDSRMLNSALGVDERGVVAGWGKNNAYPGRPHALLMRKPFNDNAPFRQETALMSSMDVPALVCEAIGGCPEVERPDTGPGRVRVHYYDVPSKQIDVPGRKTTYDAFKKAVVRGTMFRLENWSRDE